MMPAQLQSLRFCAQWFMTFHVKSSSSDTTYVVTFVRGEGGHCTCKAYEHFRPKSHTDIRECKHIRHVMKHACMWNEQWYNGGDKTLQPVDGTCTMRADPSQPCARCGGPTVGVTCAV